MKLRASLSFGIVAAVLAACAAQQDIAKSVPDVAQCIESIVVTAMGTPDIAGILAHCGATVADIEKVIADLEAQDGGVDGSVAASPERAAKVAMWKKSLVDYKAAHPAAK